MLLIAAARAEHGKHLAPVATRLVNKQKLDWELPLQSSRLRGSLMYKARHLLLLRETQRLSQHGFVSSANTPSEVPVWDGGFVGHDVVLPSGDQTSPNLGCYANPRLKEARAWNRRKSQ